MSGKFGRGVSCRRAQSNQHFKKNACVPETQIVR
jgi:hypothetical protein